MRKIAKSTKQMISLSFQCHSLRSWESERNTQAHSTA